MWVLDHLADLESDFAVFHRIEDPWSLPGPEFFRKAHRIAAYRGVMYARAMAEHHRKTSTPQGHPTHHSGQSTEVRKVPLAHVLSNHPDLIERRRPHG